MSTPSPPDPKETAAAQGAMNRDTAITQYMLGATNQKTPFGSLEYTMDGSWGSPSQPAQSASQYAPNTAGAVPSQPPTQNWSAGSRSDNGGMGSVNTTPGQTAGYNTAPNTASSTGWENTPRFTATQTLSPELQAIMDNFLGAANTASGNLQDSLSKPLDFSGLPAWTNSVDGGDIQRNLDLTGLSSLPGIDDFGAERQKVEDALFQRLNPQIAQDRDATESQLFARGIRPGTEAYDREMQRLNSNISDQRTAVTLAGGQEQSRLFNDALSGRQQGYQETLGSGAFANSAQQQAFQQALANAGLSNSGRQQGIEEQMLQRSQPINEIAALLQGTQIAGPQFTNTPQPGVNGVDYTGLVNQQYQAEQANSQGMMSGLFGVGSSLLGGLFGLSDRRLKSDIRRVGTLDNGLPVYVYVIGGQTQMGVMADEVEQVLPEAVAELPSGVKAVNYRMVAEHGAS